ncbi:MAG: tRNA epoxyqueuosine(34) reductase QueG [Deltaproteobacteria bacterium]|nr:tRNA epoxyqueuosine(34) reductase QueG [Deltaproteobacteria bacterium]
MKQIIRDAALRLGFDLCAFAPVVVPPPHAAFVQQWLADGNAAGMPYIQRHIKRRLDPQRVLYHARTIISVASRYRPPPLPPIDWQAQLRGRVAAYALGADYHLTMGARLGELARTVEDIGGGRTRVYVDTGAILEREWAAAGGLGWFGKNTNILHTGEGSWFLLGEVLTTLELDPDAPWPDHCGTCTRCLDLCPTGALSPGYRLDARRCISYWTIEHRGSIPREMRPQLGNWVFGCDICQEVCPWNEKLARRESTPEADQLVPYLPDLLQLDEAGFAARYQTSALFRTRREGLARNAAVVLGNTRNPAAVAHLAQALRAEPSPVVRAHVAWALGQIGDAAARRALDLARAHAQGEVAREIDAALSGAA